MPAVRVSPKFQVVIPREIRERARLEAGQAVDVLYLDGRIQIVPVRPMRELRGTMPGLDAALEREPDRFPST